MYDSGSEHLVAAAGLGVLRRTGLSGAETDTD
jgi:hypothetical protein